MATILQIGEKTFSTDNGRGTKLILKWSEAGSYWMIMADNATVRAYRTMGVKIFHSLAEVEQKYKTWRGISALVEMN